jgi:pimeloyl-ACP methyl ester carboxylesterase
MITQAPKPSSIGMKHAMGFLAALCLLLISVTPLSATAGQLFPHCTGIDVREIQRPLTPNSREAIIYKYRVIRKAKGTNPTVIYIPGGPGQTSMDGTMNALKTVPEEFGLVATDPRGAGCNSSPNKELPDQAFSTAAVAGDVNAILISESLDPQQVYIYGSSFGTVAGSTISNLRNNNGELPLRGLILEGTLGKNFVDQEYSLQYTKQWQTYKSKRLPIESKRVLESVDWPLSTTRKSFSSFINGYLLLGGFQKLGHPLDIPMQLLETPQGRLELERNYLVASKDQPISEIAQLNGEKLWANIWCGELHNEGDQWANSFVGSDITVERSIGEDSKRCRGVKLNHPFDSASLKIREPIIYFQGANDPATSLEQARHHFESNNSTATKVFYLFPEMGHPPFGVIQILKQCGHKIWRAINEQRSVLEELNRCGFEAQLHTK